MDPKAKNALSRFFICLSLLTAITVNANGEDLLNHKVRITGEKATIYQLLNEISNQSGCLFIYDSQIIDNDKSVKVHKGEYSVQEAISLVTGNDKLEIIVVGNHILLKLPSEKKDITQSPLQEKQPGNDKFIVLGGRIYDHISKDPVAYASVAVSNSTIGTISNQHGEFKLVLHDSLLKHTIKIFHVGYQNHEMNASLLVSQKLQFPLEPKIIPLQEVVVSVEDPLKILQQMVSCRTLNYSFAPVYITAFYHEGINYKGENIELTEAALKIYKTGYQDKTSTDQVKLIKMRRIVNSQKSDTLFTKMKSGINSCLRLDIMKDLPDFLIPDSNSPFVYTHTDVNTVDNRKVNVVSFEQNKNTREPLYKGELFVDAENNALVESRFEINPHYVEKATGMFVQRKSPGLKLTLQRVYYTVSYKSDDNGIYYINHIRGELEFKTKKKRRLFSNTLYLWFEMVNCKTDTTNIVRFPKNERLQTQNVFSETKYQYDSSFWENFNVILPEDKLKELIINNLNQISEPYGEDNFE